jgi:phosphatidylinositol glycan class K
LFLFSSWLKISPNMLTNRVQCYAIIILLLSNVIFGLEILNVQQLIDRNKMAEEFLNRNRKHSNNWAVLVCTSRFWFNYRHIANTLSFYHIVKQLGIPDSNIILMLADDVACNARNSYPAQIFNNQNKMTNLYGDNVEVDYRGYEVTVENFIRMMTGRHDPKVPRNKRLMTDEHSNIIVYMTGHGGNEFLKFQDQEEINSMDIADVIEQMNEKRRYNEMLLMVDTCQAGSLFKQIYSPNVISAGSSMINENSYSHHSDYDIGVAVIDRFTYFTLEFFERYIVGNFRKAEERNLAELFAFYNPSTLHSTPFFVTDLSPRPIQSIPISDFFGSDIKISIVESKYRLIGSLILSASNITETQKFVKNIPQHVNVEHTLSYSWDFTLVLVIIVFICIMSSLKK